MYQKRRFLLHLLGESPFFEQILLVPASSEPEQYPTPARRNTLSRGCTGLH
jgi:hypothetical protein